MTQHIVNQVHKLLIKKGKTVAVAESCSAGLLSSYLARISGSSLCFTLGVVAYSNQAKETVLGIPPRIITRHGAVSKPTAMLMAENVRKIARADFGIGITGIAGPTGGTPKKPVGTVFMALASKDKTICKRFRFTGNRTIVRKKSALGALELLSLLIRKDQG